MADKGELERYRGGISYNTRGGPKSDQKEAESGMRKHYQRASAHAEEAGALAEQGGEKNYRAAADHQAASDLHMKIHNAYKKAVEAFGSGKFSRALNHMDKAEEHKRDLQGYGDGDSDLTKLRFKHTSLSDHAGSAEDEVAPAEPNPPATP